MTPLFLAKLLKDWIEHGNHVKKTTLAVSGETDGYRCHPGINGVDSVAQVDAYMPRLSLSTVLTLLDIF